jgi:hypothetical protein
MWWLWRVCNCCNNDYCARHVFAHAVGTGGRGCASSSRSGGAGAHPSRTRFSCCARRARCSNCTALFTGADDGIFFAPLPLSSRARTPSCDHSAATHLPLAPAWRAAARGEQSSAQHPCVRASFRARDAARLGGRRIHAGTPPSCWRPTTARTWAGAAFTRWHRARVHRFMIDSTSGPRVQPAAPAAPLSWTAAHLQQQRERPQGPASASSWPLLLLRLNIHLSRARDGGQNHPGTRSMTPCLTASEGSMRVTTTAGSHARRMPLRQRAPVHGTSVARDAIACEPP